MKKLERQTYFLGYCQFVIVRERRGQDQPGRNLIFTFSVRLLFAYMSIPLRLAVVKSIRLESSIRIISQTCNLKIHNALRRHFWERNRPPKSGALQAQSAW